MLKRNGFLRVMIAYLVMGATALSVRAELGLQALAESEGGFVAVGNAVKDAVADLYSSTDDAAQIQAQLIAILNEAAETGDEGVIRYTIVAVMMAGGSENMPLSKAAIDNSTLFTNYSEITAFTVAACEKLIPASEQSSGQSGGGESGGGESGGGESGGEKGGGTPDDAAESGGQKSSGEMGGGGGGTSDEFGGGISENPFDDGSDSDILDGDIDATPK